MIISHKYRFIFVKTLKTAGTSIEVFLSRYCDANDVLTPIIPPVEPHIPRNYDSFYNHIPAHKIRKSVDPDVWRSYFKFCVERNPWDKTISHYHNRRVRDDTSLTFERYLSECKFPINFPKYTEPTDPRTIIVDEVLYYEQLASDLDRVFESLGIPFLGTLGVNAKSEYGIDRRHYRDIYTEQQASVVRDSFRHELALHDYVF